MNHDIDRLHPAFDPRISDWLEADPDRAPREVLDTVLAAMPSIPQQHVLPGMKRSSAYAAGWRIAVAIVVVATFGGLVAVRTIAPRSPGGLAGAVVLHPTVTTRWTVDPRVVLTIHRDPTVEEPLYWRVATYDEIRPKRWNQRDARSVTRPAYSLLVDGTFDDPGTRLGLRTGDFRIMPAAPADSLLVSPSTPVRASEAIQLTLIGEAGFFGAMRSVEAGTGGYEISARLPVRGVGEGELNVPALRAASASYPTAITERYLDVPDGIIGPNAAALQRRIEDEARSSAPIDLANAILAELRSSDYRYNTDVSSLDCTALSIVECFATYREGFCQYFATTMVAVLRRMGVPSRIAEGFLPGERDGVIEVIRNTDAHAWVEVYFPGYGWLPFDPTPVPEPERLPAEIPAGI
jgi:transglutaminase-like putative cysteine protease